MKIYIKGAKMKNNNKCYARTCDSNNIDNSCMYGNAKEMPCQVNCEKCRYGCRKESGDISCRSFVSKARKE